MAKQQLQKRELKFVTEWSHCLFGERLDSCGRLCRMNGSVFVLNVGPEIFVSTSTLKRRERLPSFWVKKRLTLCVFLKELGKL